MKVFWRRLCLLAVLVLAMGAMVPALVGSAAADPVDSASASGFGATLALAGETVIPPTPSAEASAPPDSDAEEILVGIPADPLLINGTLIALANAHVASDIDSALQVEEQDVAGPYNARGVGQIEDLEVLITDDVTLLEADLVRAEAVGVCNGGQVSYSANSEIVNLAIGGEQLPLNSPLQDIIDAINEVLEQTTLNQVVNVQRNVVTELPGGGIAVSALVVTVLEAAGDDPVIRIVLGHGEAGGVTCADDAGVSPQPPVSDDDEVVQVRKTPSAQVVAPGQRFDYQITVTNAGEDCTLEDVRVVDTVTGPAGSSITATSPTADSVEGLTVTWNDVGPIPPGETVSLLLTVAVPADAPLGAGYSDQVTVSGVCDGEDVGGGDQVSDVPRVAAPGAGPCNVGTSVKDASHSEVPPGGQFVYNVLVFNAGGEACQDITVTDTLDDRVAFVSCTPDCTVDGQQVSFEVASLAPGASQALSIVVQAAADATGTLRNVAVINPGNGDPHTAVIDGPEVTDRFVIAPIGPARPPGAAPADVPLPRTGGSVPLGAAAALLLAGGLALAARGPTRRAPGAG